MKQRVGQPPNPADVPAYTCTELDAYTREDLETEVMYAQTQIEECRKVQWKSWWAFRKDEALARLSRLPPKPSDETDEGVTDVRSEQV